MMLKIKHVTVAALCMALASVWAQSAKPFASMANGELVSEQDLSDYLDRRIDLRQIARNAWGGGGGCAGNGDDPRARA